MRTNKGEIKKHGIDMRGAPKNHFWYEDFRPPAERDWVHRAGRSEAAAVMI